MPNAQARGPHLVGCLRLLIQCIHSYPPYWRLFLHLQTEDGPYCGDRDPLIMGIMFPCIIKCLVMKKYLVTFRKYVGI